MLIEMNDYQARMVASIAAQCSGVAIPPEAIQIDRVGINSGIHLKNIGGCPINLRIRKVTERRWELPDSDPDINECRWASKFPSYVELVATVKGTTILEQKPAGKVEKPTKESNVLPVPDLIKEATVSEPSEAPKTDNLATVSEASKVSKPPSHKKDSAPRTENYPAKKKKSRR